MCPLTTATSQLILFSIRRILLSALLLRIVLCFSVFLSLPLLDSVPHSIHELWTAMTRNSNRKWFVSKHSQVSYGPSGLQIHIFVTRSSDRPSLLLLLLHTIHSRHGSIWIGKDFHCWTFVIRGTWMHKIPSRLSLLEKIREQLQSEQCTSNVAGWHMSNANNFRFTAFNATTKRNVKLFQSTNYYYSIMKLSLRSQNPCIARRILPLTPSETDVCVCLCVIYLLFPNSECFRWCDASLCSKLFVVNIVLCMLASQTFRFVWKFWIMSAFFVLMLLWYVSSDLGSLEWVESDCQTWKYFESISMTSQNLCTFCQNQIHIDRRPNG